MAGSLQMGLVKPYSPSATTFSLQMGLVKPYSPSATTKSRRHFTAPLFSHMISTSSPYPLLALSPKSNRLISRPITAAQPSDQGDNPTPSNDAPPFPSFDWTSRFSSFISNNFLPLALVGGVVLALVNPSLGCLADRYYLSKFSTFGIFIISGLTLRGEEIGEAAEAWPVGIFGLVSILFLTPFFSKVILQLQLQPQEFVTGLAIFSCMPTTLSSGVALTRLAGGNAALALAMTLISSLLGILIVPFSVSKFIAAGVGITVPTKHLLRSLILTLLVPLLLGKVFRESSKGLANFVDQKRKLLSVISALLLALVPWIQVSRSSSLLLLVKHAVFLVAVGMGALLHVMLLAFNALAIQGLSILSGGEKSVFAKRENASALLIVASQKTLPVMVAVVEQLGGALGESGLLVLPCVAAHMNQIIMDSFFVNLLRQEESLSGKTNVA